MRDRRRLSRCLAPAAALLVGAGACVRQPAPPTTRPTGATTTPAPERRWRFAYSAGTYTYLVESSAVIDLSGDTAGVRDSVKTAAVIRYRLAPAAGGTLATGTVDSFTVTAARSGQVQHPMTAPVTFEALVDTAARRVTLRGAYAAAATSTDCTSPARTLAVAGRDLLVALPGSLEQGQRWRDSLTTVTCRGDIPITNRVTQEYVVEGRDSYAGTAAVRVRRTAHTVLEGSASPRGQAVKLTGSGDADTRLWVDAAGGRLLGAAGEATTRITLEAAGQSRSFTQRAVQRVTLRP
jgi:hypothetical protein